MVLGKKCSICHTKLGWGAGYKIKDIRNKKTPPELVSIIPNIFEDNDPLCHECTVQFHNAKKKEITIDELQKYIQTGQETAVLVEEETALKEKQKALKEEYWSAIKQSSTV